MAGMDVETLPWSRHIYLGKFSHLCNFFTVLYLSQEESHLDNYNLDPPTAQSRVLAPYTMDTSLSLISIGDSHSIQVIRRARTSHPSFSTFVHFIYAYLEVIYIL